MNRCLKYYADTEWTLLFEWVFNTHQNFLFQKLMHIYICRHTLTCIGPGMQDNTLSMFSVVTSTSSTATSTSPEYSIQRRMVNKINIIKYRKELRSF